VGLKIAHSIDYPNQCDSLVSMSYFHYSVGCGVRLLKMLLLALRLWKVLMELKLKEERKNLDLGLSLVT
jgi:hypothetical protein